MTLLSLVLSLPRPCIWCTRCCGPERSEVSRLRWAPNTSPSSFTILFTIATSVLLGRYMAKVFTGQRTLLDPLFGPDRTAGPAAHRRRSATAAAGLEAVRPFAARSRTSCMWLATLAIVSLQQYAAAQPRRHRQHGADARVQHDLELHRPTPTCSTTAARPGCRIFSQMFVDHVPAVRDRRHRHGGGRRDHPRPRRQPADALGNFYVDLHARHASASSCRWLARRRSS